MVEAGDASLVDFCKHMTSFTGKSGTVESCVRSQRWRPLEPEMAADFRKRMAAVEDEA